MATAPSRPGCTPTPTKSIHTAVLPPDLRWIQARALSHGIWASLFTRDMGRTQYPAVQSHYHVLLIKDITLNCVYFQKPSQIPPRIRWLSMWIKHLDFKNKNLLYASNYQKQSGGSQVAGLLGKLPVFTGAWHRVQKTGQWGGCTRMGTWR